MKNTNLRKKQLKKIFDQYITMEQYGDFKEIIDEILYRRAVTFDFSSQRMKEECQKLINNLKEIYFYKGLQTDTTLGIYDTKEKSIHFNTYSVQKLEQYISRKYQEANPYVKNIVIGREIFQVLSHEIFHAIAPDGITEKREYRSDKLNFKSNRNGINEVVTESSSNITTAVQVLDDNTGFLLSRGYPEITFTGALLSCALGISEKELYKYSLCNRDEYNDLLKTKIYNGKENPVYQNLEDFLDFYLIAARDKNAKGEIDFLGLISGIPVHIFDIANQESWREIHNLNPEILGKEYVKYKRFNLILDTYIKSQQGIWSKDTIIKFNEMVKDLRNKFEQRMSNIYLLYKFSQTGNWTLNEKLLGKALAGYQLDLKEYSDLPSSMKVLIEKSSKDNIQLMLDEFKDSNNFYIAQERIKKSQVFDKTGFNENIYERLTEIYFSSLRESDNHYIVTPQQIAKVDCANKITLTETQKLPKLIQHIMNRLKKDRSDD